MIYGKLNPHVKLIILSTLDKPRTLYDVGKTWFSNIGRFYNSYIIKQADKAVKLNYLTKNNSLYKANTKKIIDEAIKRIDFNFTNKKTNNYVNNYKIKLELFYHELKEFSYPTYLNLELIKRIVNDDPEIAHNLDIQYILQLPFILRYIEKKDKSVLRVVLSLLDLEDYYSKLFMYENENIHLLDNINKRDLFGEYCAYILNSYYPKFFTGDENLLSKSLEMIKRGAKNGRKLDGKKHKRLFQV